MDHYRFVDRSNPADVYEFNRAHLSASRSMSYRDYASVRNEVDTKRIFGIFP